MIWNLWFLDVIIQEGQSLANDRGLFFTETSALSGDQVSELLVAVGKYRCRRKWRSCFRTFIVWNIGHSSTTREQYIPTQVVNVLCHHQSKHSYWQYENYKIMSTSRSEVPVFFYSGPLKCWYVPLYHSCVCDVFGDSAHRVYECIGAQQGGLSEWQETPLVDLRRTNTINLFTSCCKVGP